MDKLGKYFFKTLQICHQTSQSVPVVGLRQLIGHWQDGQRSVLLGPDCLTDTPPVDEAPLLALDEHFAQQLLVIHAVNVEGLRDGGDKSLLYSIFDHFKPIIWF